ncbi:unnamed protein product [Rhizophagus irregularis]|nr:unnamed protein product [Rhizophagus irregularis]CAB4429820.1 unnamed protein product [Rhizophagus irregularis]
MKKTSNKKHSKGQGDDLIDNKQKPLYNKKVRSSGVLSSDDTITNDFSNKTSNDVENDKDNSVNKDNSIDKDNGVYNKNNNDDINNNSENKKKRLINHKLGSNIIDE